MKKLKQFLIKIPEENIGEVLGKLNHLGAWLSDDSSEALEGLISVKVKIPSENIENFSEWFDKKCNGKGRIENHT